MESAGQPEQCDNHKAVTLDVDACVSLSSVFPQEPVVWLLEAFSGIGCTCEEEYKAHVQDDSHSCGLPISWPRSCLKGKHHSNSNFFSLFCCLAAFAHWIISLMCTCLSNATSTYQNEKKKHLLWLNGNFPLK